MPRKLVDRVGVSKVMNDGHTATVVEYRSVKSIDVQWEDGTIKKNCRWDAYINGELRRYKVIDPNGVEHKSMKAMCKAWGQPYYRFLSYKDRGYSLLDCLTRQPGVIDFAGNKWGSVYQMTKYYGLPAPTYVARIRRGWPQKSALLTPAKVQKETAYIGKTRLMNCGLRATIVDRRCSHRKRTVCCIRFEDGYSRETIYGTFNQGNVSHPVLSAVRKAVDEYFGFTTQRVSRIDDSVFYKCTCSICGENHIMTPQQMISHFDMHVKRRMEDERKDNPVPEEEKESNTVSDT